MHSPVDVTRFSRVVRSVLSDIYNTELELFSQRMSGDALCLVTRLGTRKITWSYLNSNVDVLTIINNIKKYNKLNLKC